MRMKRDMRETGSIVAMLVCALASEVAAADGDGRILQFDRAALHEQAVQESLKPIRPGVPGKTPFWNGRANSFIYAPAFEFEPVPGAGAYRFTVTAQGKSWSFEADVPWADLGPVWRGLPLDCQMSVSVVGLDSKGGRETGVALIGKKKVRQFERRAAFNGPYHEAAYEYTGAGERWLKWLASTKFKWNKEGNPQKLGQYPCKDEAAAIAGLTAAAVREQDAGKKKALLDQARNAGRTLIKGSFPADWALGGLPPTYGRRNEDKKSRQTGYDIVMMPYPASAGLAYLDLCDATKDKEFLDAAVSIADVYKKTQLPTGSWPLMMDGKTGERIPTSTTDVMPFAPIRFFERLISDHGRKEYQPMAQAAWKWVADNPLAQFRFEGQFEDTSYGADNSSRLSHHTADNVVEHLVRHAEDDPACVPLAEEVLRWAEDQFIFWEPPPQAKDTTLFTPRAEEQHHGTCTFEGRAYSSDASHLMIVYGMVYEATGKELYLAKAVAFANAMTALQKHYDGNHVSTSWAVDAGYGGWPNCHVFGARNFIEFGEMLQRRNLRVPVRPDAAAKAGQ